MRSEHVIRKFLYFMDFPTFRPCSPSSSPLPHKDITLERLRKRKTLGEAKRLRGSTMKRSGGKTGVA